MLATRTAEAVQEDFRERLIASAYVAYLTSGSDESFGTVIKKLGLTEPVRTNGSEKPGNRH